MSLNTTATTEWNGVTMNEAAQRFVELCYTKGKGYLHALYFHATLPPHLKDYVKYSLVSGEDYRDARQQLEGILTC